MIGVEDLGRCHFSNALTLMDRILASIKVGEGTESIIIFEPYPAITLGRDTAPSNLLVERDELTLKGIEVINVSRGGDVTWHGPGQVVAFPLINIKRRGWDVYSFIERLVSAIGAILNEFGILMDPQDSDIGVWVQGMKIASIGLRHEEGIMSHGIALNVNPDFGWLDYINPCGDPDRKVTSMDMLCSDRPNIETVKKVLLKKMLASFETDIQENHCNYFPGQPGVNNGGL